MTGIIDKAFMEYFSLIQEPRELLSDKPQKIDFSVTTNEGALSVVSLSLISQRPDFLAAWEHMAVGSDVYYALAYLRVAALHHDGEILLSWFEHSCGDVFRAMVLRPIKLTVPSLKNKTMCDLVNPYQYGGPIVQAKNSQSQYVPSIISAAQRAFEIFCQEQNVVCEFIRFHPLLGNNEVWRPHYKVTLAAKNIVIDLRQTPEEILIGFSRGQRRNLNRCKALGVTTVRMPPSNRNMAWFSELYAASMKRLKANEYYFFPNCYFAAMAGLPEDLASLYIAKTMSGQPISALLVLHGAKIAHTHLLGDRLQACRIPHTILYHMAALDMKERQRTHLHLGGASSNQQGVIAFKERLSPLKVDYFTGSKIYDKAAYECLSLSQRNNRGVPANDFSPEYRAAAAKAILAVC